MYAVPSMAGRVRSREEAMGHESFLRALIGRMSANVSSAGGPSSERVSNALNKETTALDARFELGKSSDAYLMQGVLPLQGANDNHDLYPSGLYPEIEDAGRLAVVKELQEHVVNQLDQFQLEIDSAFQLVTWLLNMREIRDYMLVRFSIPGREDLSGAQAYLRDDSLPVDKKERRRVMCDLFEGIVLLLTKPYDAMREQYTATVINNGIELRTSIERLARATATMSIAREYAQQPAMNNPDEIGMAPGGLLSSVLIAGGTLFSSWTSGGLGGGAVSTETLQRKQAFDLVRHSLDDWDAEYEKNPEEFAIKFGNGQLVGDLLERDAITGEVPLVERQTVETMMLAWGIEHPEVARDDYLKDRWEKEQQGYKSDIIRFREFEIAANLQMDAEAPPGPVWKVDRDIRVGEAMIDAFQWDDVRMARTAAYWENRKANDIKNDSLLTEEEENQIVQRAKATAQKRINQGKDVPGDSGTDKSREAQQDDPAGEEKQKEWFTLENAGKAGVVLETLGFVAGAAWKRFGRPDNDDPPPLGQFDAPPERNTFCAEPYVVTSRGTFAEQADKGLVAATWALMEFEGRIERDMLQEQRTERLSNLSPIWNGHTKPAPLDGRFRTGDGNWWRTNFLDRPAVPGVASTNLSERLDAGLGENFISANERAPIELGNEALQSMRYAVARGLCAYRAPTHAHPSTLTATALVDNDGSLLADPVRDVLVYSLPGSRWGRPLSVAPATPATTEETAKGLRVLFPTATPIPVSDFVELDSKPLEQPNERRDVCKPALWCPATFESTQTQGPVPRRRLRARLVQPERGSEADPTPRQQSAAQTASHAAVLEHLIDHYARKAVDSNASDEERKMAISQRAAAKIEQLHSLLATGISQRKLSQPVLEAGRKRLNRRPGLTDVILDVTLVTRPCMTCPDGKVLYPVDAGLAMLATQNGMLEVHRQPGAGGHVWMPSEGVTRRIVADDTASADAQTAAREAQRNITRYRELENEPVFLADGQTSITREAATVGMRSALGNEPPLYCSPPVGHTAVEMTGPDPDTRTFVSIVEEQDLDAYRVGSLRTTFRSALKMCEQLTQLECEEVYLNEQVKELTALGYRNVSAGETLARQRRSAVYNDALREAALNGDRLYSFAQMLSGIIAESVEAIAVIDDSQMLRQQHESRDRRKMAAQRAADAHMQIVRSVFGAVLRDSGLKIGLADDGTGLTVLNTTLQKQAAELTSKPVSEGFFANSVRLDELLTKGSADMSIDTLFSNLQSVARELQKASESFIPVENSAANTSLEFLRSPRNCLFLQWKNETHAAIRRAYDLFINEMRQHGHMMRHITAYELIEGSDATLCNAFAEFCGQYMAMTRMQNPSHIVYVSQAATNIAAQKTKIALQRLVNTACSYVVRSPAPGNSRAHYFGGLGTIVQPAPVRKALPLKSGWHTYPKPWMGGA
tara:strand:+ start:8299 stop:12609 length:4311 start_codon:yes stop_codon:yes gene_type:complete